jgi:hypothetical protein
MFWISWRTVSPEEITGEMSDLELDDVASLRFASRRLDHPIVTA